MAEQALELEKKAMENKYTLDEPKAIQNDLAAMFEKYEKEAKGPAKLKILAKEMPKYVKRVLDSAVRNNREKMDKLDSDYKSKIQEIETKLALDKQELERLQDIEKTVKFKVLL